MSTTTTTTKNKTNLRKTTEFIEINCLIKKNTTG